jgi:hypothetical protein
VKTQADWTRLSTGKLLKELAKCEKDLQLQAPPDVSEEQFSGFLARRARDYALAGVDIADASPLLLMALREQAKEEQALAQIYARAGITNPGASPLLLMALSEHGTPEQKQTHQLLTKRAAIKSELVRRERTPGRAAHPSNSTAKVEPSPVLATESRLQRRLAILDMLATEKQTDNRNMGVPESKSAKRSPIFAHLDDYRSVTMRGKSYTLTSRQAQMIESLHRAHESGNADVSIDGILEKIGTPNSRWQDTFKSNPEAKKALIKSGARKGTLRLNL